MLFVGCKKETEEVPTKACSIVPTELVSGRLENGTTTYKFNSSNKLVRISSVYDSPSTGRQTTVDTIIYSSDGNTADLIRISGNFYKATVTFTDNKVTRVYERYTNDTLTTTVTYSGSAISNITQYGTTGSSSYQKDTIIISGISMGDNVTQFTQSVSFGGSNKSTTAYSVTSDTKNNVEKFFLPTDPMGILSYSNKNNWLTISYVNTFSPFVPAGTVYKRRTLSYNGDNNVSIIQEETINGNGVYYSDSPSTMYYKCNE